MTTGDDETVSERLAQVRADRRHLNRLRIAERRDAVHENGAEQAAECAAESPTADAQWSASLPEDSRTVLLAEEAALAVEQSSLVADRDFDDDADIEI